MSPHSGLTHPDVTVQIDAMSVGSADLPEVIPAVMGDGPNPLNMR
jgi:hypothetical protein